MYQTKRADRITTIQLNASTRDRLYRLKFRMTYDEYLNFLMDQSERIAKDGTRKPRAQDKLSAMIKMTKGWVERNTRWENGRMKEIDPDGQ